MSRDRGKSNGVLTGIEDFLSSTGVPVDFYTLPFYNGLGIVVPRARMTKPLHDLIESFYAREALLEIAAELDRNTMHVRAELLQAERRLARRTEALQRARLLLEQKKQKSPICASSLPRQVPAKLQPDRSRIENLNLALFASLADRSAG